MHGFGSVLARMEDAWLGSIDVAIEKAAFTPVLFLFLT
jgi:uncharacterized protein GlcG (DUF336 family)